MRRRMGDSRSSLDRFKGFWEERLSFLENYTRFTKRDAPLPSWSSSDVDEFIASDPVNGPTVFLSLSLSLSGCDIHGLFDWFCLLSPRVSIWFTDWACDFDWLFVALWSMWFFFWSWELCYWIDSVNPQWVYTILSKDFGCEYIRKE